jgi:hypothetical protein
VPLLVQLQPLVPLLVLVQPLRLLPPLVLLLLLLLVLPLRPARCPQPADHRWSGRLPGWPP